MSKYSLVDGTCGHLDIWGPECHEWVCPLLAHNAVKLESVSGRRMPDGSRVVITYTGTLAAETRESATVMWKELLGPETMVEFRDVTRRCPYCGMELFLDGSKAFFRCIEPGCWANQAQLYFYMEDDGRLGEGVSQATANFAVAEG